MMWRCRNQELSRKDVLEAHDGCYSGRWKNWNVGIIVKYNRARAEKCAIPPCMALNLPAGDVFQACSSAGWNKNKREIVHLFSRSQFL